MSSLTKIIQESTDIHNTYDAYVTLYSMSWYDKGKGRTLIYRTLWLICYSMSCYILLYKISNSRIFVMLIYFFDILILQQFLVKTMVHACSLIFHKFITSMHCYFEHLVIKSYNKSIKLNKINGCQVELSNSSLVNM